MDDPEEEGLLEETDKQQATEEVSLEWDEGDARKAGVRFRHVTVVVIWFHCLLVMATLFATVGSYTWATPDHPWTSIPWYLSALKSWRMNMWDVEHVFMLVNILVYFIPAVTCFTFTTSPSGALPYWFHFILTLLIVLWDVAMFVLNSYKWGTCKDWALCINQDPLGNPSTAVIYWWFVYFGHLAVTATTVVLLVLPLQVFRKIRESRGQTIRPFSSVGMTLAPEGEEERKAMKAALRRRKALKFGESRMARWMHKLTVVALWIHAVLALATLFATVGSYTWVTPDHPWSSIPWYTVALPTWRMNMWNVEHIFLLLTIPMFMLPVMTGFTYTQSPISAGTFYLHLIPSLAIIIWDAGMFVWNSVKWGQCQDWALCRNQDPLGDPTVPERYWYFIYFGQLVMTITTIVILAMSAEVFKKLRRVAELSLLPTLKSRKVQRKKE